MTLYRYPPPLRAGLAVTLEAVQDFSDDRLPIPRQVTGADASQDGSLVALRSYEALTFFTVQGRQPKPIAEGCVNLRTLNEFPGEGVGLGPHGDVVLTSEGVLNRRASMVMLRCRAVIREH